MGKIRGGVKEEEEDRHGFFLNDVIKKRVMKKRRHNKNPQLMSFLGDAIFFMVEEEREI